MTQRPTPKPTADTLPPTTNRPTTKAPTTSSPTRKGDRGKCLVACPCGTRTDDSSELTCSLITSRDKALEQAVWTVKCDTLDLLPLGTFSSLAVDCIVNLGTSSYDMDKDVEEALKNVSITVGEMRSKSNASPPLLEAAFARIRAVMSARALPEGTALPGWSIGFWKSYQAVDINQNSKLILFDKASLMLQYFDVFKLETEGYTAQMTEASGKNIANIFGLVHSNVNAQVKAGETEVAAALLNVDEYLNSARDSVKRLKTSGVKLLGSRGSDDEGLLGQLSSTIMDLRDKTTRKQQADLAAARQMAFINFFQLAFEVGSTLVGGIGPAIKALKGVWQLGKNGKEAVKGVYKSLRSGVGFRAAFRENSDKFKQVEETAGGVGGNATIFIEHGKAALSAYDAYSQANNAVGELLEAGRQNKETFEEVDLALSRMRGLLAELVTKSEAISETLLRASEWMVDIDNTSVEETAVDATLSQSAQLWASTASRVIFMLTTELGVCPSQGESNPFADRRRRLTSGAPAHLRPELSLRGRDTNATQAMPTELRRALDAKSDAAVAKAEAEKAWDINAGTCASFMQELNEYSGWGAAAQGELFSVVRGIRDLIVVKRRVAVNQRVLEEYGAEKVKSMTQQGPRACAGDDFQCRKRLFLAESNAGFAVSVGLLESRMIATIEAFCRSYAYARPSMALHATGMSGGSSTRAEVHAALDGSLCRVAVGVKNVKVDQTQCSEWPDRIKALVALMKNAWSAGYTNMLRDETTGKDLLQLQNRCQLRSPSFLRALFPDNNRWAKGASATFDVRLPSFGGPKCYPAAEVDSFVVVFRDAACAIVPRPPGFVSYGVTKINSTAGFKYSVSSSDRTVLTEHAYVTGGSKKRLGEYEVVTGQCPGFQNYRPFKLTNKTAEDVATELCIPQGQGGGGDDLQVRPPLYGSWMLSLDAWPDNEPMPASVEIHADFVAENGCNADVRKSDDVRIVYSAGRTVLQDLDANAQLQGAEVCGGVDFNHGAQQDDLQIGLPGTPQSGSTRSSSVTTIIACAAAGALIVAAALVAARSRRHRQLGASAGAEMLASVGAENPVFRRLAK